MTEFLVHECRQDDGATTLTGVVNVGEVKVGTVFETASGESAAKSSIGSTSPIHLSVTRITAYGHQIDELPEGMTGELIVEGEGVEELRHGRFVSSK